MHVVRVRESPGQVEEILGVKLMDGRVQGSLALLNNEALC